MMNCVKYYTCGTGIIIYLSDIIPYIPNGVKSTESLKFNGEFREFTKLNGGWYHVPLNENLTSILKYSNQKGSISSWVLRDASYASEKIPLSFTQAEVDAYMDDDGEYIWRNNQSIQSMYTSVTSPNEVVYIDVLKNRSLEFIGHIEGDVHNPISEKYKLHGEGSYSDSVKLTDLVDIIHYREIDKILVPLYALHTKPCSISAATSYNIIRTFVKDHIDHNHAIIKSDYDFCFSVEKIIYTKTTEWDIGLSKTPMNKRPKFSRNLDSVYKTKKIFDISPKGYEKYPVAKPFTGESLEDLHNNIKSYLNELIATINKPMVACECCGGHGYVVKD